MATKILHCYQITYYLHPKEKEITIKITAYTETESIKLLKDWWVNVKKGYPEDIEILSCVTRRKSQFNSYMLNEEYYNRELHLIYGNGEEQ